MQPRKHQAVVRITHSAEGTRSVGRMLAAGLQPRDLLCLRGDLGAGKTTFIQGLAQGLGVRDLVTSPSFTLIHQHAGRIPLYHIDLYRVGAADIPDIGLHEVLDCDAVVAIEWADHLPAALCPDALDIEIAFDDADENTRLIRVRARGRRSSQIISLLADNSDARTRS